MLIFINSTPRKIIILKKKPSKSVFPLLVVINTFGIANVVYMRTVFKYAQRLSGWGKKAIIYLECFP